VVQQLQNKKPILGGCNPLVTERDFNKRKLAWPFFEQADYDFDHVSKP
jgi:hypothetical protein